MIAIHPSKISNLFADYCNQRKFTKPLLLWFAGDVSMNSAWQRYSRYVSFDTDSWKPIIEYIPTLNIGGVSMNEYHSNKLPVEYTDDIERIEYYPSEDQLNKSRLDYCIQVLRMTQKPVVCFIRDHSIYDEDAVSCEYLDANFEQVFVLDKTFDEWLQSSLIGNADLRMYLYAKFHSHPELYIKSSAYRGMPNEAVHTIETELTCLMSLIKMVKDGDLSWIENTTQKVEVVMEDIEKSSLKSIIPPQSAKFRSILERIFS